MAQVQRRKRRRDFRRSSFRFDDSWGANRSCDLDSNLLADALRFSGLGYSCAPVAHRDPCDWLAEPKGRSNVLRLGLRRGNCDLAPPFKPFPAHARHRTALYPKVKIAKTAIIGAGGWGTALARLWANHSPQVFLWGHNPDRIARVQTSRENSDYLPGVKIPHSVCVTSELGDCSGADLIVFVTPSTSLREIAKRLRNHIGPTDAVLLSCTKGIEHCTGMRMSQILGEIFPGYRIAVLSGPNLAVEVGRDFPTATVIGCGDADCAASLQRILGSPRFRIYTSTDVISIELGGALKNVFAIAAGISDGLELGDNSKAALVTRSLAELVRLGQVMGGNANAFYGLSGVGDLILTCYSDCSRNHTVGKRLGRGEPLADITASMKTVAEGIPTTRSAWECSRRLNVATPIIDQVYAVLYQQQKTSVALEQLLKREPKPEQVS